jgi:hypothetical protein
MYFSISMYYSHDTAMIKVVWSFWFHCSELKNKSTGVDIYVPRYDVIPGHLGGTVMYHVIVVSRLFYFKTQGKYKESDVVQFMVISGEYKCTKIVKTLMLLLIKTTLLCDSCNKSHSNKQTHLGWLIYQCPTQDYFVKPRSNKNASSLLVTCICTIQMNHKHAQVYRKSPQLVKKFEHVQSHCKSPQVGVLTKCKFKLAFTCVLIWTGLQKYPLTYMNLW